MSDILKSLENRYSHFNPLLFTRSVERSISAVDLFDILEQVPPMPVIWDENVRRWVHCDDLLLSQSSQIVKD